MRLDWRQGTLLRERREAHAGGFGRLNYEIYADKQ